MLDFLSQLWNAANWANPIISIVAFYMTCRTLRLSKSIKAEVSRAMDRKYIRDHSQKLIEEITEQIDRLEAHYSLEHVCLRLLRILPTFHVRRAMFSKGLQDTICCIQEILVAGANEEDDSYIRSTLIQELTTLTEQIRKEVE